MDPAFRASAANGRNCPGRDPADLLRSETPEGDGLNQFLIPRRTRSERTHIARHPDFGKNHMREISASITATALRKSWGVTAPKTRASSGFRVLPMSSDGGALAAGRAVSVNGSSTGR